MSDRFAPAADAAALIIEEEAEKASALAFGRLLRLFDDEFGGFGEGREHRLPGERIGVAERAVSIDRRRRHRGSR